jgi:Na+-driven multidrug efflux pump
MSHTQLTLDTDEIEVSSQTSPSHPLLTHVIGEQFLKLAFPIIIALMINGLYSFVDAIFITRGVGINAMASVSAVFPINMLIISISAMLGSGMASIISRHLGCGDKQTANQIFSSSLLFSIAIGFGLSVLLYLIRFQIYPLLALPQELLNDADAYLVPILLITTISFASGTLTESFRYDHCTTNISGLQLWCRPIKTC